MRDQYNVDWVLAFQNRLQNLVNLNFGHVSDWPFLKGLRYDAYEMQNRYVVLVVYPVSENVVTSLGFS
jgi:hypothetical protein